MLKTTEAEIEAVREYFECQASDLEVTFMHKVYSEAVLNARHDLWDIHTNKDRGRVDLHRPLAAPGTVRLGGRNRYISDDRRT